MDNWEKEYEERVVAMRHEREAKQRVAETAQAFVEAMDGYYGSACISSAISATGSIPVCAGVLMVAGSIFALLLNPIASLGYLIIGICLLRRKGGGVRCGCIVLTIATALGLFVDVLLGSASDYSRLSAFLSIGCYIVVFRIFGEAARRDRAQARPSRFEGSSSAYMARSQLEKSRVAPSVKLWVVPSVLSATTTLLNCASTHPIAYGSSSATVVQLYGFLFITVGILEAISLYQACNWVAHEGTFP